MGCINKNEIIKSELSQPMNNDELFKIKEENIVKNNSLKNSNNNKSNNRFEPNSNNSGSNVTSNNKINNNQLKDNNYTISSLMSNDYFINKYIFIGEINNQLNIEEYKIQLKSNPNIFRSMRAIKKISSKNQNNEEEDNSIFEEVNILKAITHKHICQLYECIATPSKYFLIMDYCKEGYLENKLKWSIKYSENQIKYLAFQLFGAVKYLNQNNYMHTDIKPINILIDEITKNDSNEDLFNIKLLNFGSYGQSLENNNDNKLPYYIAPEIINNTYDVTSDVWSIGVIIYQMFYGEVPFGGENVYEVYDNIKKGKIIQSLSASSNLRNLLDLIFVKDCKKRINVNKCLEHNWFSVSNKAEINTDVFKNCIIEEINTDLNVNKIDEKNSQNTYNSKNDEESGKSNKNNVKRKSNKLISFKNETFNQVPKRVQSKNKKPQRKGGGKNGKISPLIKYCILFIKYYIRINFQKDKEINKLNNIYLKYKIENNWYLFINYINNTKKISFDSFNNDKNNINLIKLIKEQISDKEQVFKILIENKRKIIEINLKKSFDQLKKSTVEEIKKIFKESNNTNLYEIQKYKLYFNDIEFEMEKNKYKEIYLFIDFYKLLINSINKLYAQFISNNISTNVDSNYTTTTQYAMNNKSKESIKNENSKDNFDKIDKIIFDQKNNKNQYEKEKIISNDINKANNKNKDNKSNNNISNINNSNINISNSNNINIMSSNNNENIDDNFLKDSNKKNNINIFNFNSSKSNANHQIRSKRKTLNLFNTNVLKKDKYFLDLVSNKHKRRSFRNSENFFENFNRKNLVTDNEVNNNNIDFKDDEEDEYETEKRKNDKNRFDPEKFLAIIGFS